MIRALIVATALASGPLSTYTVEPCRFVDTRDGIEFPYELPGPVEYGYRFYRLQGACGVPVGAKAVLLNVTATEPTVAGHLVLFSTAATANPTGGSILPPTSNVNFAPGQTVANAATVELGPIVNGDEADLALYAHVPGGTVHVVIDVVGYLK